MHWVNTTTVTVVLGGNFKYLVVGSKGTITAKTHVFGVKGDPDRSKSVNERLEDVAGPPRERPVDRST